ncbi:MAG: hypothetical protein A3F72_17965 [Bacteroidetes bacterium RIFCSPLOWO2_12_FULL_35_15]|nr:MAG: hypothetical protein A3F72_17965 [Bacteroidetes bacterium RIFCSPLOWO2_12_FULL_35_15]
MQKIYVLIFTFLLIQLFSFAQKTKIDSLNAEFKNQPSNIELEFEIGVYYYKKGDYEKSLLALNDVVKNSTAQKNNTLLLKAFTNIGNVYSDKGENIQALEYYQKALKIAESNSDKKNISSLLKNIGVLYATWKDFPKALEHYQKAEAIACEIMDSSLIADCYNNKGVVYEQQQNYEEALLAYKGALNYYLKKNPDNIAMEYSNMAIVYKLKKDYASSVDCNLKAIDLAIKSGNKWFASAIYNNIGNLYVELNDPKKAIEYCNKSVAIAKEINASEILINVYETLADANAKAGDYKNAFNYQKQFALEKDKFISAESAKQVNELQTKYETEKKENEITLLQQNEKISTQEIKEQKFQIQKRNYLIAGVLLLLLVLAAATYFGISKKNLKNKLEKEKAIKETEENERMRIAKDIHDDLGSGLSKINFLSEFIYNNSELLPEIRNNIKSVSETAKNLVENMRDLIWALNPENTTLDNLVARIREYSSDYLEDFPIELMSSYPSSITPTPIYKDSHREIFMVVKECLNNIVKHSTASIVNMKVRIVENDLTISIHDNGLGFNTDNYKAGSGLRNMKNRISAIYGKLSIESEPQKGTGICILIPLDKIMKS